MKKMLVMLLVVALAGPAAFAAQPAAPRIVAKELRYDAGKVKQGEPVSHVFEITNNGTAELVIESLQPG